MKKILVTGCGGQVGTELVAHLRGLYGDANVMASDFRAQEGHSGPFALLDVRDGKAVAALLDSFKPDTVMHLAGILSARGEERPQQLWETNMGGTYNMLEAARERGCAVFFPSSIAAFGPGTPADRPPQDTIQRPTTIYGVSKVTGELLGEYYHLKYGLDVRGVRFPGLVSYEALPGGGTTDYAVDIFYAAAKGETFRCPIQAGTFMDMMYMPDALHAAIQLMEADPTRLKHRNAFNIASMSFDPEIIYGQIRKYRPDFVMEYAVDPLRQSIAESWPNHMDDHCAREEWDWAPRYDLDAMTRDMLEKLSARF